MEERTQNSPAAGKVLLVDDVVELCKLLQLQLEALGYCAIYRTSAADALAAMETERPDVVVTDLEMPGGGGDELCTKIVAGWPDVPVLVMTAHKSLESAVAALRAGAQDFLVKPIQAEALAHRLQRALQVKSLRSEVKRLRGTLEENRGRGGLIGASAALQRVQALVDQVASSDASVLVTGESGTGKELVARALHERGKRATGPFIAINCAALPEQLLESELFGYEKGAFTGAGASRDGLLVQATGGTLFLDEVGEMPLPMQAKLLRGLQERSVRPVGGTHEVKFDARIVAATARDLESAVEAGSFRLDLLYRLDVIHLELPPLRARGGDVLILAQHFLDGFAARAGRPVRSIAPEAAEKLLAYPWPGNARELQNCMERAVALARYDQITLEDLPAKVRDHKASQVVIAGSDASAVLPLAEIEKRYILSALELFSGNKTLAARALGVGRKTLYRKLEEYAKGAPAAGPGED